MATGGFYISFAFPVVAALIVRLRGRWEPGELEPRPLGHDRGLWSRPCGWCSSTSTSPGRAAEGVPWYQDWAVFVMTGIVGVLGRGWPTSSCAPKVLAAEDRLEADRSGDIWESRSRESAPARQQPAVNVLAPERKPAPRRQLVPARRGRRRGRPGGGASTRSWSHLDDHVRHLLRDCRRCRDDAGRCTIDDGFEALLRDRVLPADAIIFGTPLYWYGVSGQLKTFLDRLFCFIAASEPEADMFVRGLTGKRLALVLCLRGDLPGRPARGDPRDPGVRALHALAARRRRPGHRQLARGRASSIPATRSAAPARLGRRLADAAQHRLPPRHRAAEFDLARARGAVARSVGSRPELAAGELERTQREPQLHDVAGLRGGRGR